MFTSTYRKDEFYIYPDKSGPANAVFSFAGLQFILDIMSQALEKAHIDAQAVRVDVRGMEIHLEFPTSSQRLLSKLHVKGEALVFKTHSAMRGEYTKIPLADPDLPDRIADVLRERVSNLNSKYLVRTEAH